MRVHGASEARIDGAGGTFEAWSAEVAACPTWRQPTLRFGLCLGTGFGVIAGAPVGLVAGRTQSRPLAFVEASPSATVRLAGAFWLRAEAGVIVPVLREAWEVIASDGRRLELYRAAVMAPVAAIVMEIRSSP